MSSLEKSVKQYISSLLTSTPLVVTIHQLNKDYWNTIGEPIPYQKLGYNSLEHLLRSITDTVQVKGVGSTAQVIPIVSEKTAHVNQLVTSQKTAKPKNRFYAQAKRSTIFIPTNYNSETYSDSKYVQNAASSLSAKKIYYPVKKNTFPSPQNSSAHRTENISKPSSISETPISNNSVTEKSTTEFINRFQRKFQNLENNTSSSHETSSFTPSTCSENSSKPSSSNNTPSNSFTKQRGRFGDMNRSLRKSEVKQDPEDNLSNAYATTNTRLIKPKKIVSNVYKVSEDDMENNIPVGIRNNLRTLIGQFPEGIWCAKLPETYRKMFNYELNYRDLGFTSLIYLCMSLSSIFHYVRPSTEDYKLYDRSRPLPKCVEKTYTIASYGIGNRSFNKIEDSSALPDIDWTDVESYLPQDILPPGSEIPKTFISEEVQENDDVEVIVGEIYDPSKFWIYLENSDLDTLMDEIQDFYKENAEQYLIPENLVREGIFCVQVIFGEYHRALIVDRMPELEDMVRVIFIDYGTMTKVPSKGLCFLHINFTTLPAQAIRCRLANIFPLEEGGTWSREACKAFRKLVMDRDITAKISTINREEQFLEVYLADTTDQNVYYINDKLVEEGFAQAADKERKQPIVDPIYNPIVKLIHLFPTFLELEHGLAPSTAEMEIFHECNVPINFCYPQYFFVDHSSEENIIKIAEEFHENNCIKVKRRNPSSRYFDLDQFKQRKSDLSIFGELEDDIKVFLNIFEKLEPVSNDDEDFTDADEDCIQEEKHPSAIVTALTSQPADLNVNEKDTINVLKQDLMMTEDIMKNINKICKTEFHDFDTNFIFIKGEPQNSVHFNENRESVYSDSVPPKKESPNSSDSESHSVLFYNPLSTMKFEDLSIDENTCNGNSDKYCNQNEASYDLQLPDVHLQGIQLSALTDRPLSFIDRLKEETEQQINSFLENEIYPDVESPVPPKVDDFQEFTNYNDTQSVDSGSALNPFLIEGNETIDSKYDLNNLNPNNPFLNFLENDPEVNCDTDSNVSTVYDSPNIAQNTHSWSSFTDMSAETISQLGKTLRSSTSSSNCVEASEDRHTCSTQTLGSDTDLMPPKQYYPQPEPKLPYNYPPWSLGYNTNPHYSVRFVNFQGYMYQSQFGPMPRYLPPPAVRPPPGFLPRWPVPQNFDYRAPQNYSQECLGIPNALMQNQYCVPPSVNCSVEGATMSTVNRATSVNSVQVNIVSRNENFHDGQLNQNLDYRTEAL